MLTDSLYLQIFGWILTVEEPQKSPLEWARHIEIPPLKETKSVVKTVATAEGSRWVIFDWYLVRGFRPHVLVEPDPKCGLLFSGSVLICAIVLRCGSCTNSRKRSERFGASESEHALRVSDRIRSKSKVFHFVLRSEQVSTTTHCKLSLHVVLVVRIDSSLFSTMQSTFVLRFLGSRNHRCLSCSHDRHSCLQLFLELSVPTTHLYALCSNATCPCNLKSYEVPTIL